MAPTQLFRIARNHDPESRLPFLLWLPIDGGLVLKARDSWPRSNRVFCAHDATPWDDTELVDEAPVLLCRRRGAAIDLVLDRPSLSRSQFVFTQARGRPGIWWQTQKTAQAANPGARIPRGRSVAELTIVVDTREKYGWKFAGRSVTVERRALPAGDYGALVEQVLFAVVERKTLENLATSLSDGSLAFQLQRLAELPRAAVVVEGDYPTSSGPNLAVGRGSLTCSADWPCDTRSCLSCSPALESSPRSGPTAFLGLPSPTSITRRHRGKGSRFRCCSLRRTGRRSSF